MRLNGNEKMDNPKKENKYEVLDIVMATSGVKSMTQRTDRFEGTIKKPPTAIAVRI